MNVWEALILGIVQGITEFLPVSSSGHLVLLQKIFGISEPALLFDTALHGGTMLAVIVILRRDILGILRRIVQPMTAFLIIATIPLVIAALLLKDIIEEAFRSASFLGLAFLVTSALLFISGGKNQSRSQTEMTWKDALVIGLFQAIAVFPGVSRSGSAISGALSRKLNRDFAARFSFLLSIPAILGALVLQIKELTELSSQTAASALPSSGTEIALLPLIAGTAAATVVAFFSVKLAIKIVREHNLYGFALYTGILGFLILADKFVLHIFF